MDRKREQAKRMLQQCRLCPRLCEIDRTTGQLGYCRAGIEPVISGAHAHFGEEAPLVGHSGSGTIFMTYCSLGCIFCQNYDISHLHRGKKISVEQLAAIMLELQRQGCCNINAVSPTHYVPQIIEALRKAAEQGLSIPFVYNCGGYEEQETLKILDGITDIYMPDFKFLDKDVCRKFLNASDYPEKIKAALKEMHHQVGDLVINRKGTAERGLLIRHLVMPGMLKDTKEILRFIAEEISENTYVNIMKQYHPQYRAFDYPEISRRITRKEYEEACRFALELGLHRGFPHF